MMVYVVSSVVVTLILVGAFVFGWTIIAFYRGKKQTDKKWQNMHITKIQNPGATKHLSVLPLIDWGFSDKNLKCESGVSYLIQTDESNILFDCGLNIKKESPSPLIHNMTQLGLSLDSFDTIIISHNHMDHVGGLRNQKQKTFSIDLEQVPLTGKNAYVPVPMEYPGLHCTVATEPRVVSNGVTLTGVIDNYLYLMGPVSEQAIAIRLEGKGIVLIVGCGHQTLERLLAQVKKLFDEPLYGIIGGLHLPYGDMQSNIRIFGKPATKYIGTGKLPWNPVTLDDVKRNIALLEAASPQLVALSPHDSSPDTLKLFQMAFKEAYRSIVVGERIEV